jgi:hypothetical protein
MARDVVYAYQAMICTIHNHDIQMRDLEKYSSFEWSAKRLRSKTMDINIFAERFLKGQSRAGLTIIWNRDDAQPTEKGIGMPLKELAL